MTKTKTERIQWHPAFDAAVQIELEEDAKHLTFEAEHLLSKKPLQIDLLIVKKKRKIVVRKNIGHIFRSYNVIEYKSPDDNLSIDDFYKVYGYTCFYKSDGKHINERPAQELTITFACYHYPVEMLQRIREERGITVKQTGEGIYYLEGDALPIQLLIIPELSKKDNYWLSMLRKDLEEGGEIDEFVEKYDRVGDSKLHEALADAVMRANRDKLKEEYAMCDALREICRELMADEIEQKVEMGLEEGRAQGVEQGVVQGRAETLRQVADSLKDRGFSIKEIAEILKMDVKSAKTLVAAK